MNLPPLPKIDGDIDLVLDVFTHKSLRYGAPSMNDDYGDTDRLAELGNRILDLAVTYHYYSKRPMLQSHEIAERSRAALSDDKLESWLESYGLKAKLRLAPGEQADSSEEIRRFFNTYVGALHVRNGNTVIQNWISQLIDPAESIPPPSWAPGPIPDASMSSTQSDYNAPPPPSQPSNPPPPLPSDNYPTISMATPNLVSLSLVNQTAAQRGIAVTYTAEQVGPAHMPTWTVRCLSELDNRPTCLYSSKSSGRR
ncbi:hypothetical protein DXG01_009934 [Tephrocybe rancida]|nr:hypothetical protein DXG01_009934 [Tephrocybe rancida]